MRLEHRSFKTPSNKVVELTTVASNYHIEMSPGDAGIYDRYVVQVDTHGTAMAWNMMYTCMYILGTPMVYNRVVVVAEVVVVVVWLPCRAVPWHGSDEFVVVRLCANKTLTAVSSPIRGSGGPFVSP